MAKVQGRSVEIATGDETRIGSLIDPQPNGCWIYRGPGGDYGHAKIAGRYQFIHRYVYDHLVGPIPEDHVLHHTCQNRRCCNSDHLEPMLLGDHTSHHQRERYSTRR